MIPELLSPAGNWECARAAVANGAQAIYFGLDRFNARMRADNFTQKDLPDLMFFLHSHGLKGYVTMNTLIFTTELEDAVQYVKTLNDSLVDGVIVQDLGLARLISETKKTDPALKLELHASTQMTLSSPEGIHFVERFLDLQRIVLSRELSIKQIGHCVQATKTPIEVFVHGALCVSYSGQCLTSESLGRRSANRGECAQACRMPYDFEVDGHIMAMGERRYLLSPQDLCAVDRVPQLLQAGVTTYKIEGRLKSPEYVAATTLAYSRALKAAQAGKNVAETLRAEDDYALQMVFSRGFTTGWLDGTNHPYLTHGRHGKKRGIYAGKIVDFGWGWLELDELPSFPIEPGDGFVVDKGTDRNEEQGGRIWKVEGKYLYFHGKASHIDWESLRNGNQLWKTDDPALNARIRQSWSRLAGAKRSISIHFSGKLGENLVARCIETGDSVRSEQALVQAQKRPLTLQTLQDQFGRLGDTPFSLGECRESIVGELMLPVSQLNQMRRDLVAKLDAESMDDIRPQMRSLDLPLLAVRPVMGEPQLTVLCREAEQLEPVLAAGITQIYLETPDARDLEGLCVQARQLNPEVQIFVATPRIQKPLETGYYKFLERAKPEGILVRNLGAAEYFRDLPYRKVADFSLNVANPLTADVLKTFGNFEKLTVSYDLNAQQVVDLLRMSDPSMYELTLHQHMPMFHMEHCVFCAFLSEGQNYKNCGKPCKEYRVRLGDKRGHMHPLRADIACRSTLYNGQAQSGATYIKALRGVGLNQYRIEFLDENAEEVAAILSAYQDCLAKHISAARLIQKLELLSQLGTTAGTLGCEEIYR